MMQMATGGNQQLPQFNHNGHIVTPGIHPEGESGRRGFSPLRFLRITFRGSSKFGYILNILWPFVPAAIALRFARGDLHLLIFIINYIAMVPAANTVAFSAQEFSRKLPKVLGVLVETSLGSVIELILFIVLVVGDNAKHNILIIKAAILGSILANLLLCLGVCFLIGGLTHEQQDFDPAVSEIGTGMMLVAGTALIIPAAYYNSLLDRLPRAELEFRALRLSRGLAVILIFCYFVFVFFQLQSHHSLYSELLAVDEKRHEDRHKDLRKEKLTLTESIIALLISLACVSLIAIALVHEITFLVIERGVPDAFVGLILIPIVEKAAEHITAVDEMYDNQPNYALSHVLGSSIQTALLNTPIIVILGWILGKAVDINFAPFDSIILILAILGVGNFLRDGKSTYMEGVMCVSLYFAFALSAWNVPNPEGFA